MAIRWLPIAFGLAACQSPSAAGGATSSTATAASAPPTSASAPPDRGIPPPTSASVPPTSASAPPSATPAPAVTTGLHAEGNDAEAVAEIEKVRAGCRWAGQSFADGCTLQHAWIEWAAWPGRQELLPTLATILSDANPAVRHLAATGLEVIGTRPIRDLAIATKLFDALEEEKNPNNCPGIGMQAASVDLDHEAFADTKLAERANGALRGHPLPKCRVAFVSGLASYNAQLYDVLVELAKADTDAEVRKAAMGAMRGAASKDADRQRNNCEVWMALIDEAEVTSRVIELVGGTGIRSPGASCVEQWDPLLTKVETLVAADDERGEVSSFGLIALTESRRATPQQRDRVAAICRKIASRAATHQSARAAALHYVAKHDPDGEAFAKQFLDDPAEQVKKAAQQIVGEAPR